MKKENKGFTHEEKKSSNPMLQHGGKQQTQTKALAMKRRSHPTPCFSMGNE
jgi:hypothetical protein